MGVLASAVTLYRLGREAKGVVGVVERVIADGGSPLRVLRAVAEEIREDARRSEGGLELAILAGINGATAELEVGIRRALQGLELVTTGCLVVVDALGDPRVRLAIEGVIATAVDAGWQAASLKAKLRTWAAE